MIGRVMIAVVSLSMIGETTAQAEPMERRSRSTLCTATETSLFSCRSGRRTISVCDGTGGTAYRSGVNGSVDIQIPGGAIATASYSGGGETQIVFGNGGYRYVVYQNTVRTSFEGNNDPAFDAGVAVVKDGRVISRLHCDDRKMQFGSLEGVHLPEVEPVDH